MGIQIAFLSINEICRAIRVSRSFIYEQIRQGKLATIKFGGATRIAVTELARWIKEQPGGQCVDIFVLLQIKADNKDE